MEEGFINKLPQLANKATLSLEFVKQQPKVSLIAIASHDDFMKNPNLQEVGLSALIEVESSISFSNVIQSKKLNQTIKSLGEPYTIRCIQAITWFFCESVGASISPLNLIQFAKDIMNNYPNESIDDIILSFKQARISGNKIYKLTSVVLHEIWKKYLDEKYQFIENRILDEKSLYSNPNRSSYNYDILKKYKNE